MGAIADTSLKPEDGPDCTSIVSCYTSARTNAHCVAENEISVKNASVLFLAQTTGPLGVYIYSLFRGKEEVKNFFFFF